MARTRKPANIIGPQLRKLRNDLEMTQEEFAAKCQLKGLDISRGTLSQIEAQVRCVTDDELLKLANILQISTDALFPSKHLTNKKR